MSKGKIAFYGALLVFGLYGSLTGCGSEEMVEVPTKGLITTVKEVQTDQFKIEDEVPVNTIAESRIIAKYMNGNIDTFTIEQAKLYEQSGGSGRGIYRAASAGFFGYMIGRSMSRRPSSGAYVDQKTYDKVNKGAGNTVRSTAKRTPKPSSGKSGYGGKSTRSFGG